ncbi:MAG: hypothetical protein AB1611_20550 [bacterium]
MVLIAIIGAFQWRAYHSRKPATENDRYEAVGIGNAQKLLATYNHWKVLWTRAGGEQNLALSLGYSKGRSVMFTRARGQAVINLIDGSVCVNISGLPEKETFDVWMIGRRPDPAYSQKPCTGQDRAQDTINLGTLKGEGGKARLQVQAGFKVPAGLEIEHIVVARTGQSPDRNGLLFGSPSLFQKLYYSEISGRLAMLGKAEGLPDATSTGSALSCAACRFFVPSPAYADFGEDGGTAVLNCLKPLIDRGEQLFFTETFEGNGRTCGTCHPATNNFTLDPAYIATLPPRDPLFIAEHNPNLAELEKPELLRKFALILENVDGFSDPTNIFVMRGVPHLLGLSNTILSNPAQPGEFPVQRTGWGGDGAPGTGSLREFAIGAVRQHFTKTLDRVEGRDFRLPTNSELDALEAFQLSLGRQEELDLEALHLKSEIAELGKETFLDRTFDDPRAGKCQRCHGNAGANSTSTFFNDNRNTGVEVMEDQPARLIDPTIPVDGGFGQEDPGPHGGFGDGTFNITSLIEAADTPPFFHNNSINTIEGAVGFFNDDAFNNSPSGSTHQGLVKLESTQVQAVAAFLRVINVLDNIRSSDSYDTRAKGANLCRGMKLLKIAISETEDAIEVLRGGAFLHPDAVLLLEKAGQFEKLALAAGNINSRNSLIDKAIHQKSAARELMVW